MTGTHGAAGSALGYLYQTAWALLELLRRGPDTPDAQVSVEMYDDVAWDVDGTPTERLQLKHHLNTSASIGDKSVDLWRTIRVWLDDANPNDADGALLVLVTTAVAPTTSGVYRLREASVDLAEAQRLLETAARESKAAETAGTRERFLGLPSHDRQALVSRIRLVDGAPQAVNVDLEVRKALSWTIPRAHADMFMEMVWGWWNREVLSMMQGLRGPVSVGEVQDQLAQVREQFTADRLPTLLHLADINAGEMERMLGDRPFVAQLRLIDWPKLSLQRALTDYYRTFVHQTRWMDDDLIGLSELTRFGAELVDEWQSEFEFMGLELAQDATESDLKAAGVRLLRKLLDSTAIRVRPRYDEQYFARGKRHELADTMEVGWHPHFVDLLAIDSVR